MKQEYLEDVLAALAEVKSLRWVDAQEGQLDYYTEDRPPVAWPCCLVEVAVTAARNLSAMAVGPQRCTLTCTLQIAFNDCASLNSRTPGQVRDVALRRFDVLQEVKDALHGRWFDHFQQPYSRTSCVPERREDGLKVYRMTFEAAVVD